MLKTGSSGRNSFMQLYRQQLTGEDGRVKRRKIELHSAA